MSNAREVLDRLRGHTGAISPVAGIAPTFALEALWEAPKGSGEAMSLGTMLDRIEAMAKSDPALASVVRTRLAPIFAEAPSVVVLDSFPLDPGTVEASIWDNQPFGKAPKIEGSNGRERPARYAISLWAMKAGNATPFTSKTRDFLANVGDLFTPDQVRARIKAIWKGLDPEEANFVNERILPLADANGLLVARLCVKRSAKAGGGTHWHPYHYAMVSADELARRSVSGIALYAGKARPLIGLPPCSTVNGKGDAFEVATKTTKSGNARSSLVIGQSRATDLTSRKMRAWKTGDLS